MAQTFANCTHEEREASTEAHAPQHSERQPERTVCGERGGRAVGLPPLGQDAEFDALFEAHVVLLVHGREVAEAARAEPAAAAQVYAATAARAEDVRE